MLADAKVASQGVLDNIMKPEFLNAERQFDVGHDLVTEIEFIVAVIAAIVNKFAISIEMKYSLRPIDV